ncbi:hypothetical protein EK904_005536 [Melospiza melodia maxima]|nr:hypothetical protein EK904_005536 [Melospiza melodia maxima]
MVRGDGWMDGWMDRWMDGCVCTRFPRPRPPVTSRLPPPALRHRGRMLLGSGNGALEPARPPRVAAAIPARPLLCPLSASLARPRPLRFPVHGGVEPGSGAGRAAGIPLPPRAVTLATLVALGTAERKGQKSRFPSKMATKQFLEEINKWTGQYNVSPLSWNVAVKFLMARKFDVLRAIELFHSYRFSKVLDSCRLWLGRRQPHHRPDVTFETQRNGLVFIYDMAGSQYTNFELDLSKKILNLLKVGAFPARLKKVFIVGAPMWFRVPYSIISLLLKEKLRERNGHPDPLDELILVPLAAPKDNGSVHVPGPKSVTLQELLDHVSHKQKRGIYEEYEDIRRRSPAGTFACSLAPYNQDKNRYGDVPCLDQTRVKLAKPYSRPELTDYINASFMDGYKQRNAYIGTQGPLENTYGDFWRMVWEQNVLVIVMTTR